MKHLGDITKLRGDAIPPVNVIIGGSPCQDLSVAGKRAGLAGARSGLFMEQIRLIKEMREHDRNNGRSGVDVRPRYMVWENVPGAFSSNKGEDFRAVLEETARIADGNADVPQPPNGKWSNAGCIMGNGWSIAWRVHDAQFWGVPQRRRRISLVADFGGQSAPEILFERKGVPGDIAESGETGQGATRGAENGADTAGCNGKGWTEDVSYTLNTIDRPAVFDARGNGDGATSPTLTGDHQNRVTDYTEVVTFQNTGRGWWNESDIGATVRTPCGGDSTKANLVGNGATVRRLTPLECERLQGYQDGWTDIPGASDSARYKALGNSIALPFWRWMLTRMSTYLPPDATIGSLFDGIGGFPLVWSELHGGNKSLCAWASEIEDFPIAVTKYHFPECQQERTETS